MSHVQSVVLYGRRYVDVADLELYLRRVQQVNPNITVDGYVNHIVKQVCERE